MTVQTRTVTAADADTRLDRWFRRHFPQLTQGALQKMLRTGQVRVDGKRAEANTRLAAGQEIRIPPLPEGPPPETRKSIKVDDRQQRALEAMVIYRDDEVLALDKPPGLAVQGGPGILKNLDAMLDALRFGAEERPRLVHRLDKDTSGVLLLARSAGAAAKLAALFRGREVKKTYWAVVVGEPEPPEGRIDLALAKQGGNRGERVITVDDPREGARAITDFATLDAAKRRAAWLELSPLTGRTHQLRVHCSEALGTPILGDGKYGGSAAHMEGLSGQLHLHARALRLPHPTVGTLEIAAALPPHMKETFRFFGFEEPRTPKPRKVI
jgi:23S rRNA pseudouridine955/2504/2580 synthase